MEKCCFKDCANRGETQAGFDFFACEPCLEELEQRINQAYAEQLTFKRRAELFLLRQLN